MDPISIITTAIVAGAAAGASDAASQAVRDAYGGLKTLILRKFGRHDAVSASLQQVEKRPDSPVWRNALQDSLSQVNADQDPEVTAQAQALLALLQQQSLGAAYAARLEGSGAIAQGPGAVAAGAGGVAVGGDVKNSAIITGRGNVVNARGEPTAAASDFDPRAGLRERLNTARQLLARYRSQLTLAGAAEAARLEVLIEQTEREIRLLERELDALADDLGEED